MHTLQHCEAYCSCHMLLLRIQAGEILTRGPHVMLGYWADPKATGAARLPGGWLRTGDLGQVDQAGCLWLLGRIKDVVRSGSENVNAAAVERVLLQVRLDVDVSQQERPNKGAAGALQRQIGTPTISKEWSEKASSSEASCYRGMYMKCCTSPSLLLLHMGMLAHHLLKSMIVSA